MATENQANIKLTIAYDGTRFSGWQAQGNTQNTIQERIENAIHTVLGERVELLGAGRTDAGVHSNGQVANFKTNANVEAAALPALLNAQLPSDIAVIRAVKMPERFHARYNATGKIYRYKIWNRPIQSPFHRKHSLWISEPLNLEAMREAAAQLVGTKDYNAFTTGKTKKSTVKTLSSITVEVVDGMTILTFCGNGFLYNMVRIMTGTIIECGQNKRKPASIADVFASQDRTMAGYTAPAHGLFLEAVHYEHR